MQTAIVVFFFFSISNYEEKLIQTQHAWLVVFFSSIILTSQSCQNCPTTQVSAKPGKPNNKNMLLYKSPLGAADTDISANGLLPLGTVGTYISANVFITTL